MAEQTKHCQVCGEAFIPDRRVGDRQIVCKKLACQQERKRRSQERWLAKNPGYFKGRYAYTKAWREAHPGCLQRWRQRQKAKNRVEIQDELTLVKSIPLSERRDMQDELTACFSKHLLEPERAAASEVQDKLTLFFIAGYYTMIYKTRLQN